MELLGRLNLSLLTLLAYSLVPFLYFGFHYRFWYRPDLVRRLDFVFRLVCILLGAIVLAKFLTTWRFVTTESALLALLHVVPVTCGVLMVHFGGIFASASGDANSGAQEEYRPVPVNQNIEQLSWDDLVIDHDLRQELLSIISLLRDPKIAHQYGVSVPKGILLNGPPGTGKTTIAKVMANMAGMSFFVLKIDEVVSKWVGESEKNLSKLFAAAQRYSPAIIFIDEVDSIGKSRSGEVQWADNLLNHLLQLIDGVVKTEGLYIIAATNRADLVDEALKRSGRLNKVIEIPLPDFEARKYLFQLYLSKLKLEEQINLDRIAAFTEGCSGADIKEICSQAGLLAFRRESGQKKRDFSVSVGDIEASLKQFVRK